MLQHIEVLESFEIQGLAPTRLQPFAFAPSSMVNAQSQHSGSGSGSSSLAPQVPTVGKLLGGRQAGGVEREALGGGCRSRCARLGAPVVERRAGGAGLEAPGGGRRAGAPGGGRRAVGAGRRVPD